MKKKVLVALLTASLVLLGVSPATASSGKSEIQDEAVTVPDAELAVQWMDLLCHIVQAEDMSVPASSRVFAYAGIALYEAALPVMPGYRDLAGQLNDMPVMPQREPNQQYDIASVIAATLATTIPALFDSPLCSTLQAVADLESAQLSSRAGVSDEIVKRSVAYGESLGNAIMQWASEDEYLATRDLTYTPPVGAGLWVPTPPDFAPALGPDWGELRTFALPSATAYAPPAPIPFSSEPDSAFYQQSMIVYEAVNNLTKEQKTIADFWADNPAQSFTVPGHWIAIEDQVVLQHHLTLAQAAEMYALSSVAMADAFISCWRAKYEYNLIRPITYINRYIDACWRPYVYTPPFPEYTSGHSVVSAAVAVVLAALLGDIEFTDASNVPAGFSPRIYSSFTAVAEEIAISRLYGGVHYLATIETSLIQGKNIGLEVMDMIQTRAR